jgi:hypothetical protein
VKITTNGSICRVKMSVNELPVILNERFVEMQLICMSFKSCWTIAILRECFTAKARQKSVKKGLGVKVKYPERYST